MKATPLANSTPLILRKSFRSTMGWIFVLSMIAVVLCWILTANMYAILGSICFCALMFTYQVVEAAYDDYRTKKQCRAIQKLKEEFDAATHKRKIQQS